MVASSVAELFHDHSHKSQSKPQYCSCIFKPTRNVTATGIQFIRQLSQSIEQKTIETESEPRADQIVNN